MESFELAADSPSRNHSTVSKIAPKKIVQVTTPQDREFVILRDPEDNDPPSYQLRRVSVYALIHTECEAGLCSSVIPMIQSNVAADGLETTCYLMDPNENFNVTGIVTSLELARVLVGNEATILDPDGFGL